MTFAVAHTDPSSLRARCDTAAVRTAHGDLGYEAGAVLPDGPWQPLTAAEAVDLQPTAQNADSTLVELVKLPDGPAPAGGLASLADLLGDRDAVHLGQAASPAKTLTTTPNYRDGRRIGLHVDNWDRLPYSSKHTGRRRLCFNLGPGTRYLLLGNLDIRAICAALHTDAEMRYPHTDDLRAYISRGLPLRVYRFRLDPGEGYIAPTELLPHDGSTEDQPEPSTAAFWLGRWPRGGLESLI
ncbi:hypothetical protein ADK60_24430 [Streptomyces sp. XY431]|uniref:hypothetical protein n=1 Tax=Streptomyces sp. XY431 TaxID=1415562 RepID=UPI0006AE5A2C|nr:hypothetical protein [Streptomyces sp. XY431]KOV22884.1 hypothetical protein ADK60_24430 [Streptomyces sp. XY431]